MEIAILALGCFWGPEIKFSKIDGVIRTEVGYCGGNSSSTTYKEVCTGKTNHAEVVKLEFDDKVISFKKILDLFFKSAEFYFCSPKISRGLDIKKLKKYSKANKLNSTFYNNVKDAYKCALSNCNKNDILFIGGSNFVVAEIL
jgi:hypothetical protein